ncbi:hypothetical protein AArcCO_4079 (plasmid) [Halalkaliarchaeum sp. AArc-CO]|nr:hypothetical protein AArcCO_4079 [Halalkaliarchaeum sp. AArc-CO]
MVEHPSDWHAQDWAIVVEALAQWAGSPKATTDREERAWELIETISADHQIAASELLLQVDDDWSGPEETQSHNDR